MLRRRVGAVAATMVLAACSPQAPKAALIVTETALLEAPPARVPSPDGAMTLVYGGEDDPILTLSAGFLRRSPVGEVRVTSRLSWAPDSRSFYVNDSGNSDWSTFRLWSVSARAQAKESSAIHDAAIAELGRLNGCSHVPEPDATTRGMGWSGDSARVYVLAQTRRQTGDCVWRGVESIVVVADVETGRLVEVAQDAEARRRYPTLPWNPVTEP